MTAASARTSGTMAFHASAGQLPMRARPQARGAALDPKAPVAASDAQNPYRVPRAHVADVGPQAEAESVRLAHLSVETSLRTVGLLYYLGLAGFGISGFLIVGSSAGSAMVEPAMGVVLLALAVICAVLAYGLRGLRPWVRVPAIGASVIGLFGFPFGSILNGYVLYLLLCAKGRCVLGPDYAAVLAATPHVRYRSSLVLRVCVVALLAFVLFALMATGIPQ